MYNLKTVPTIHTFSLSPKKNSDKSYTPRNFWIIELDDEFFVSIDDIGTFLNIEKEVLHALVLNDDELLTTGTSGIELGLRKILCINKQGLPSFLAKVSYTLAAEIEPISVVRLSEFISENIMKIVIKSVGSNQNDIKRLADVLQNDKAIVEALIAENKMLKVRINNLETLNEKLVGKITELQKAS